MILIVFIWEKAAGTYEGSDLFFWVSVATRVRMGEGSVAAEASLLLSEERQVLWDNLTPQIPIFAEYQENAGRDLALICPTRVSG